MQKQETIARILLLVAASQPKSVGDYEVSAHLDQINSSQPREEREEALAWLLDNGFLTTTEGMGDKAVYEYQDGEPYTIGGHYDYEGDKLIAIIAYFVAYQQLYQNSFNWGNPAGQFGEIVFKISCRFVGPIDQYWRDCVESQQSYIDKGDIATAYHPCRVLNIAQWEQIAKVTKLAVHG